MRLLGIDYGTKRIGLALSDEKGKMAFPHSVIQNTPNTFVSIKKIIANKNVEEIVLGESKNFSGEDNPIMKKIHNFKEELAKDTGLPVYFEDEYFTSAQAVHIQGDVETLDASAATLILQSFIDKRLNKKT